jgi:1-acyl-sn-glycerol-3-phosphate acyltransferase
MPPSQKSREIIVLRRELEVMSSAGGSFPLLYGVLRWASRPILQALYGLQISGLERLPTDGPFIVAANHHNYLDAVVLGAALPRKIAFLVMPSVYHSTPLHPAFHRHVGSIPINLESPDPGAIKRALRVLEEGGVVGIFPEGPFSLNGRLVRGKPGVAIIALRAGVPVVPVAIRGTYEALAQGVFYIPRPRPLTVSFGAPLYFGRFRREMRVPQVVRQEVTHRIMTEIAKLLAEEPLPPSIRA